MSEKKQPRNTNLELFRILTMLVIVAHHYVVNSGITTLIYDGSEFSTRDIAELLFGWGGKIGINCFLLITGYFMCESKASVRKWLRLFLEVMFYRLVIWVIFCATGYETFSMWNLLKEFWIFNDIGVGFTSCFLVFYCLIPFLNKMLHALNKQEHTALILFGLLVFSIWPTMMLTSITYSYVIWFCYLYICAAWIRMYPNRWTESVKFSAAAMILTLLLSWLSVVWFHYYHFVMDCHKFLALATAVACFLFFKNLKMKNSRLVNGIAASTFGVLCIHANSDAMRKWLWQDLLNNVGAYQSDYWALHAVLSVAGVFAVCVLIDRIRIWLIEKPLFDKVLTQEKLDSIWKRTLSPCCNWFMAVLSCESKDKDAE